MPGREKRIEAFLQGSTVGLLGRAVCVDHGGHCTYVERWEQHFVEAFEAFFVPEGSAEVQSAGRLPDDVKHKAIEAFQIGNWRGTGWGREHQPRLWRWSAVGQGTCGQDFADNDQLGCSVEHWHAAIGDDPGRHQVPAGGVDEVVVPPRQCRRTLVEDLRRNADRTLATADGIREQFCNGYKSDQAGHGVAAC
ncbi:hypothetical protein MELE44368_14315 [Mycolicibacterium elephantis DSM 44368]|uniref:Uncharacterized protein n=1 Tax=Mycolicibacterium elephantis DSM 44368 TaxID=1335622 RepID=A0A439DWY6_9MYCO|nr:hypothetical protein MELE44368_14315 [Mycolicibacterium elephantis DSM 44368]